MVKLNVLLDDEALKNYYLPESKYRRSEIKASIDAIKTFIRQHRIVLTDRLIDYYSTYLREETTNGIEADCFEEDYINESGYDDSLFTLADDVSESSSGFIDDMLSVLEHSRIENVVSLCANRQSYQKVIGKAGPRKAFYSRDLTPMSISNQITRNSSTFAYDLLPDDYDNYIDWLSDVFSDEKTITIKDWHISLGRGIGAISEKRRRAEECHISINQEVDYLKKYIKEHNPRPFQIPNLRQL